MWTDWGPRLQCSMIIPCHLQPDVQLHTHSLPTAQARDQLSWHYPKTILLATKRQYMSMYVFKTENPLNSIGGPTASVSTRERSAAPEIFSSYSDPYRSPRRTSILVIDPRATEKTHLTLSFSFHSKYPITTAWDGLSTLHYWIFPAKPPLSFSLLKARRTIRTINLHLRQLY